MSSGQAGWTGRDHVQQAGSRPQEACGLPSDTGNGQCMTTLWSGFRIKTAYVYALATLDVFHCMFSICLFSFVYNVSTTIESKTIF